MTLVILYEFSAKRKKQNFSWNVPSCKKLVLLDSSNFFFTKSGLFPRLSLANREKYFSTRGFHHQSQRCDQFGY